MTVSDPGAGQQQGREPDSVPYAQHEHEMLQLVGERDRLEDIADRLAAAIAPPEVLGEHSSDNNPWRNALDYADTATQRRDAAAPSSAPPARDSGRDEAVHDSPRIKDHFELDSDEPMHEWQCPSCGATTRARMADAPTGGGRDEEEAWGPTFRFGLSFFGERLDSGTLTRADISDMLTNAYRLGQERSRGPVPDTSGRDEAREAVAVELSRHQGLRGPMDDERPDVWQNRCECGWDDGDETPGWRVRYRLHVADAVVHLPAVSQPLDGAAPTTCHHLLGEHSRVPGVGCLVYLAPAVDGDPLTLCPCTHPGTSDADQ